MKKPVILLFLIIIVKVNFSQVTYDLTLEKSATPELAWKFSVPSPVYSSPVIHQDVVYFGCLDSNFYALDLASGTKLWSFKTGGQIRSTASVQAGRLYFTSGDGKLYCLDLKGILQWSFSTRSDKQYDFADYFQSSPVIAGGAIFFGSGDGFIYSVNLADGSLNWEFKTGDVVHSSPVIRGNSLFLGSFDGYVYSLSVGDGGLLWKFKTAGHRYFPKGEVMGSPVVAGDLVIVGARDYNVYALDPGKGYCHWNKSFNKGWVLACSVQDSVLYLGGADERMLAAVEPASGNILWKTDMEFLQFGQAAFYDNQLITGTTIGKIHGIDVNTGEKVWTFSTDGYNTHRFKYFKEDDTYRDDIYSIIKSNEHFLEVEEELGGIFSSPAIEAGFLVFTSTEGSVYCLKF